MSMRGGYRGQRQRIPPGRNGHAGSPREAVRAAKLNTRIRAYMKDTSASPHAPSFTHESEIPSVAEISIPSTENEDAVEVPLNNVVGPWESKQKYLSDHYALLREDAVTPLRTVVSELQDQPNILEQDASTNAHIYEKVFIVGLTFAHIGVAARVTFSLRRSGKSVLWEQSKRLMQGTLIALTPADDMFKSICKVATVAARPLTGLAMNPPQIDIFFSPGEIEVDPQREWVMVEAAQGYFEAYRHTLKSLQKIAKEPFPLAEYIVGVEREVAPPWYLRKKPKKDLSPLFEGTGTEHRHVNLLEGQWPSDPTSNLDASQVAALRRILTKELAIVQGPPGTGKTYVSILALKVLIENKQDTDPPIIVSAHTNHALDQLLRHIAPIEPEFIRLGGMSTDEETIRPRTLYEVRQKTRFGPIPGGLKGSALGSMKKLIKEMHVVLGPLTRGAPFSEEVLKAHGIIDDAQSKTLLEGAAGWVDTALADSDESAISKWASDELVQAGSKTLPDNFGFEYEEADLEQEQEQLQELEAEARITDDDFETLKGDCIPFDEPWTGKSQMSDEDADRELAKRDLWQVRPALRGPLYRVMQQRVKRAILEKVRQLMKQYEKCAIDLKIGKWEVDTNHLQGAKIIGCTTTGLSKYRPLLDSLKPKIVLIEEAAETLEAFVTAACFETIEHLILVGDHQQLRGSCNEQQLAGDPWFLGVSMFERLVLNQVEHTQLTRQRRMHPEIRRGLMPIYPKLEDHPDVASRVPVPGMGGSNTFFFSHTWSEDSDDLMSKVNKTEATMIVGFFNYLVHNGMAIKDITVLTFYNGQRKLILAGLRNHPDLQGERFKVVTVDSYQGEENAIVLLSLVRSNRGNNIGFLSVANRVCVALSRAQRGFYIFGNARILCNANPLWFKVVDAMRRNPRRVGFHLPLTCKQHGRRTMVDKTNVFEQIVGGCDKDCGGVLACAHPCVLKCHPFDHRKVVCYQPCARTLECGHRCNRACHMPCSCDCDEYATKIRNIKTAGMPLPPVTFSPHRNGGATRGSRAGRSAIGMPQFPMDYSPHRSTGVNRGRSRGRSSPTRTPCGSSMRGSPSPMRGSPTPVRGSPSPMRGSPSPMRGSLMRGSPTRGSPMRGSRLPQTPVGHSGSPSGHPQDLIDLTPEAQPFRDFAAGGVVQADAAVVAAANEASKQEELRKWSQETEAALFGDPFVDTSLATRTNDMTLIDSRQASDGTIRNTWQGKYNSTKPGRKQERSLLD